MGRSSISGLAVALATAGGLLLYTGIKNVSIIEGLRDVLNGKTPGTTRGTPTGPALADVKSGLPAPYDPSAPVSEGGNGNGGLGDQIVGQARKYLGRPYVWARAFENGGGGDCSGLVVRVLNDIGVPVSRLITTGFLVWNGATTVPRDKCIAGDLVCWSSHIGIAISPSQMIHAPTFGDVVKIGNIWNSPSPVIRRVIQQADHGTPGKVQPK